MGEPRDKKTDNFNEFFLYSGSVFYAFAKVENTLAAYLRHYLGSHMSGSLKLGGGYVTAAAVIGSIRYAALRDMFKRVLKTQKPDRELTDYVDLIFKHVSDIQVLRDQLAHRMAEPLDDTHDGHWIIQDFATTKDFANPQSFTVHVSALKAATFDLGHFAHRCVGLIHPWVIDDDYPGPFDLKPPAWRYKPSMLAPCRPKWIDS